MRAGYSDLPDRVGSRSAGRLRNGVLGLLAAVALVAMAYQTYGVQTGPVSLLQIELGGPGRKPRVVQTAWDREHGISAAVNGLEDVRDKLNSALKPLKDFKAHKLAGPPAAAPQHKQLRIVNGAPKGPVAAFTPAAPPAARGREHATGAARSGLLAYKLAAKKDAKKDDKKKDTKLAECGCCTKPGPCGCCGGSVSDASVHNTGFYLNGNTISRGSNVIIYGNGATVNHAGGGVANAGATGTGGGHGGGNSGGGEGGHSAGNTGGHGGGNSGGGSSKGGSGGTSSGGGGSGGGAKGGGGGSAAATKPKSAAAAGGVVHKKMDKAARKAARAKLRHTIHKVMSRRPTNPEYARYVSKITKNMKRLFRGYLHKMMHYRHAMTADKSKCEKDWVANFKLYGHYARKLKAWYAAWGSFLARRRRAYKKCTKKFKKCGMHKYLTKKIDLNRVRYADFQKILRTRLKKWEGECSKGKEGKRIAAAAARAKKTRKQQKRYVKYRRSLKASRKYARGSSEYKSAIAKVAARFQKMLDFYRAGKDKWLKYAEGKKACSSGYHRGFRYVKYYARREMRLLRSINNWLSKRRKTMKRGGNEYNEVTKEMRGRQKEMSDAYKGLYKHYKIVWKCYKKGSSAYKRWYHRYHSAHKWYGRAKAARRSRYVRKARRNKKKYWKYPACGKRAAARTEQITKRWQETSAKYTKLIDYWNKKAEKRKAGSRYWRSAWYHWRRNIWRQYAWEWWMIKFDSKRSRYLKRCPDQYKAARANVVANRNARSALVKSYRDTQKAWNTKLKDTKGKSAKRVQRSYRRQQARKTWRGYWTNWIGWEHKYWKTRAGSKDEREVLYKMKKWRLLYMTYFGDRVKHYEQKVKESKKGSRAYEHRWKYGMWYRYYYLYALKRITWFEGKQLRRYKKGSKYYLRTAASQAKSFRTQINYLSTMKSMLYAHIKVCRKGSAARRYWWRWYRWSTKWYTRYRASWRSMKKKSSSSRSRRVWRMKYGTKKWTKYISRVRYNWYRVWKYYVRKQGYWRGRLYKYKAGSYRWRRAWGYYRSYNSRIVRWGHWYVTFLKHVRRYSKSGTNSYKKINASVLRWKAFSKRYRSQWRHRVAFWSKRLAKANPKGKAYQRVQRRAAAATAAQSFRKLYKQWYYAMYYSYRAKFNDDNYKKYYPTVDKLRGDVIKYYRDKAEYYKAQMGKHKVRSGIYKTYFKYYMLYIYRILHVHYYDLWFNKKMYKRYRRGTAEEKASKVLMHKAKTQLKADYAELMQLTKHRMGQIRNRSSEWNLWYRWYRWGRTRSKRFAGRRRARYRSRSSYWWHRFTKGKVGGATQTAALKKIDYNYNYLFKKYEGRTNYWKKRLDHTRLGSNNWYRYSLYYARYLRKEMHWEQWRMNFYKRWRRMYKSSSSEYKDISGKRTKERADYNKLKEGYSASVKDWVSKLPHSSYAYKKYNKYYSRYSKRYDTYRTPVKELRTAEHAWWAMRRTSYKDAKYRAAFTAMKVARDKVIALYMHAMNEWGKRVSKYAKNKTSKSYNYSFRRYMLYQYKLWIEYHRGAYFTRYAMKYKVDRSSSWFKKLTKEYEDNLVGEGNIYKSIMSSTHLRLQGLNKRSYLYRYWYRWYHWGSYHSHRYRRWYSAYKKRSVTRRRRALWHNKYKSAAYWRYYKRVWSLWLKVWVKYHRRLNYWRGRLHKDVLGSSHFKHEFYYTMRYQGRITHWISYWINFQRKLQRLYSKQGDSQFASYQRTIDAWKKYQASWTKQFASRVSYYFTKLTKAGKTNTESYRVVRRYNTRYGGKATRTSIIKELRAAERKVYYSKKVDAGDLAKMVEWRKKYVDDIDAGIKKWTAYIDAQKKGSKHYIWGYRRFFWYSYWAIREYKRGYTIASVKMEASQKAKDWKETHDRLYALWGRFNKDKDGLYKKSWFYRALTGTEYWMRKRFAAFLDPETKFAKGPWPNGYCYPLDDACKKLGVTDNLCGKCEAAGSGWKLTAMEAGLRWGGKSFDDNQNGKGSIQAQNICALAAYGNKGKVTKKPTKDCAGKTNFKVSGQVHWFGNCSPGGCATCTGAKVVEDGFDWGKFASGNGCSSDSDRDYTLGTVECHFA